MVLNNKIRLEPSNLYVTNIVPAFDGEFYDRLYFHHNIENSYYDSLLLMPSIIRSLINRLGEKNEFNK